MNDFKGKCLFILGIDYDQSNTKRDNCTKATNSLVKSVNVLVQYASQPEFASRKY